jgi:hypothetical protein
VVTEVDDLQPFQAHAGTLADRPDRRSSRSESPDRRPKADSR